MNQSWNSVTVLEGDVQKVGSELEQRIGGVNKISPTEFQFNYPAHGYSVYDTLAQIAGDTLSKLLFKTGSYELGTEELGTEEFVIAGGARRMEGEERL